METYSGGICLVLKQPYASDLKTFIDLLFYAVSFNVSDPRNFLYL